MCFVLVFMKGIFHEIISCASWANLLGKQAIYLVGKNTFKFKDT